MSDSVCVIETIVFEGFACLITQKHQAPPRGVETGEGGIHAQINSPVWNPWWTAL